MLKFLNKHKDLFFNILKITGILICLFCLNFHSIWINILIVIITGFIFINHRKTPFKALSNIKPNFIDTLSKSPGLIAFFTTLLNLFKNNQDIASDFKQAIIMGILIHLATLNNLNNNGNHK